MCPRSGHGPARRRPEVLQAVVYAVHLHVDALADVECEQGNDRRDGHAPSVLEHEGSRDVEHRVGEEERAIIDGQAAQLAVPAPVVQRLRIMVQRWDRSGPV
jgi:hypothetical protein